MPGLARYVAKALDLAADADIIWACSDSFYGVIANLLSAISRKPFIFDLYDNFEYYLSAKLPVIRQLYRAAVQKCAAVTCISPPLTELVASYGRRQNVFVLENAVRKDLFAPLDRIRCRRELGLPENCLLVGTAGALNKNRGISQLFEAFLLLKDSHPNLHLAVAGPRDTQVPQHPKVHDLGVLHLEKVPLFLNALDVAVICVKDDGFGRYCYPQKAVEIMACNVPLVAAGIGSLKILFGDHPDWLFSPQQPDSLAEILGRRLMDPSTGYPSVPTWKDLAERLERIMRDCIRGQLDPKIHSEAKQY
jgi:glycosyltransferase involved in cell wall biosynthesis